MASLVEARLVEENAPLSSHTTYKFGGSARWFATAADAAAVASLVTAARSDGIEFLVLGRGSNLVVSDHGFDGLVIKLEGELSAITIDEAGAVSAGAAVPLPKLARACAQQGRGGLEFLVAVPGSVGGAVRMNAGCHGSETGDWLTGITVFRPGRGVVELSREEMEMTYRHNSLPEDDVVLAARFRTVPRERASSEEVMREITQWRKQHQPGGTFNAGSVFKNPADISAGRLIDSLGLKGLAIGGARVSPRHANFFEAEPTASAQDVYDLVHEVRRRVADATGIELEPEIRFVGHFEINEGHTEVAENGSGDIEEPDYDRH